MRRFPLLLMAVLGATAQGFSSETTPDFGPNVIVIDSSSRETQKMLYSLFERQEKNEFGPERYALLFKPGHYDLDVRMGFYMQATGLGKTPEETTISGAVRSTDLGENCLCNFWRSVENLSIVPAGRTPRAETWAVSQGGSLRRVRVFGDLNLSEAGFSSGGFMADTVVDGKINSGSQQQWFSRNSSWSRWESGVWNMVFLGCKNPPDGKWPTRPYTAIEKTPRIREKPFLCFDETAGYQVAVPTYHPAGTVGASWSSGNSDATFLPLDQFYLAHPGTDTAATLNTALAEGKNLLFTPGIYSLEDTVCVTRPGTIVMGLGFPTLISKGGFPAMAVSDVDGVSVSCLMFDAGAVSSEALLQVGEPGSKISHAANPTFLHDIFCRVGGAAVGVASTMVTINSRDVVGDNLWLWRSDHGAGAEWAGSRCPTGLLVNGDNVTMYGLFVEHNQGYQTYWNGNGGQVFFYQSEMPYDPPSQNHWMRNTIEGYPSSKVADGVKTHEAWGVGVYCVFTKAKIVAENAIEAPDFPGVQMRHMVSIRLGGKEEGSGIRHIINGTGDSVISTMKAIAD